jgi:hypothetical protein
MSLAVSRTHQKIERTAKPPKRKGVRKVDKRKYRLAALVTLPDEGRFRELVENYEEARHELQSYLSDARVDFDVRVEEETASGN